MTDPNDPLAPFNIKSETGGSPDGLGSEAAGNAVDAVAPPSIFDALKKSGFAGTATEAPAAATPEPVEPAAAPTAEQAASEPPSLLGSLAKAGFKGEPVSADGKSSSLLEDLKNAGFEGKPLETVGKVKDAPKLSKADTDLTYDTIGKATTPHRLRLQYEAETGREVNSALGALGNRVVGIVGQGTGRAVREDRRTSDIIADEHQIVVAGPKRELTASWAPQYNTATRETVPLSSRTPTEIVKAALDAGLPKWKVNNVAAEAGDDPAALYAGIRQIAVDQVAHRQAVSKRAATALDERGETFGAKMLASTLEMTPYMAEFMAAGATGPFAPLAYAALIVKEGEQAANTFATDRLDVLGNGDVVRVTQGMGANEASVKGLVRGAVTVGVETVGGKGLDVLGGAVMRKLAGSAFGKTAAQAMERVGVSKYLTRNLPAGAAKTILRNTSNLLEIGGLNSLPGEFMEEVLDPIVAGALGVNEQYAGYDMTQAEQVSKGMKDFWSRGPSGDSQAGDTLITLIGMQAMGRLIGLPIAAKRYGAKQVERSATRDFLEKVGMTPEETQWITSNDEAYDTVLGLSKMKPEEGQAILAGLSDRAAAAVNRVNTEFGLNEDAKNYQSRAVPIAEKAPGTEGDVDAESGLSYEVDEGGIFVTLKDSDGKALFVTDKLDEFNDVAARASQRAQARSEQRVKKAAAVEGMVNRLGVAGRVIAVNTAEEGARILDKSGDGKNAAIAAANPERFKAVRLGTTSDPTTGETQDTVVIVLDNAVSPTSAARSVFHELGGHVALARAIGKGGKKALLDRVSMILGKDAEDEFVREGAREYAEYEVGSGEGDEWMAANKATPDAYVAMRVAQAVGGEDADLRERALDEKLAEAAEYGVADPTSGSRLARAVGRAVGADKTLTAKIQTLLAENRNLAQGPVEFVSMAGNRWNGTDLAPEEPVPAAPVEKTAPIPETPAAPASGTPPSAAVPVTPTPVAPVTPTAPVPTGETSAAPAEPTGENTASVPVMITKRMEADLLGRGYTQEQINKLTPQEANDILAQVASSPVPPAPAPEAPATPTVMSTADAVTLLIQTGFDRKDFEVMDSDEELLAIAGRVKSGELKDAATWRAEITKAETDRKAQARKERSKRAKEAFRNKTEEEKAKNPMYQKSLVRYFGIMAGRTPELEWLAFDNRRKIAKPRVGMDGNKGGEHDLVRGLPAGLYRFVYARNGGQPIDGYAKEFGKDTYGREDMSAEEFFTKAADQYAGYLRWREDGAPSQEEMDREREAAEQNRTDENPPASGDGGTDFDPADLDETEQTFGDQLHHEWQVEQGRRISGDLVIPPQMVTLFEGKPMNRRMTVYTNAGAKTAPDYWKMYADEVYTAAPDRWQDFRSLTRGFFGSKFAGELTETDLDYDPSASVPAGGDLFAGGTDAPAAPPRTTPRTTNTPSAGTAAAPKAGGMSEETKKAMADLGTLFRLSDDEIETMRFDPAIGSAVSMVMKRWKGETGGTFAAFARTLVGLIPSDKFAKARAYMTEQWVTTIDPDADEGAMWDSLDKLFNPEAGDTGYSDAARGDLTLDPGDAPPPAEDDLFRNPPPKPPKTDHPEGGDKKPEPEPTTPKPPTGGGAPKTDNPEPPVPTPEPPKTDEPAAPEGGATESDDGEAPPDDEDIGGGDDGEAAAPEDGETPPAVPGDGINDVPDAPRVYRGKARPPEVKRPGLKMNVGTRVVALTTNTWEHPREGEPARKRPALQGYYMHVEDLDGSRIIVTEESPTPFPLDTQYVIVDEDLVKKREVVYGWGETEEAAIRMSLELMRIRANRKKGIPFPAERKAPVGIPRPSDKFPVGEGVTNEQFKEEFGAQIAYGKAMHEKSRAAERVWWERSIWDALADLADNVLRIPRKFVGFGQLTIGVARTGAGKSDAHAYNGTPYMNLTRPRGPGAVGHEWFHIWQSFAEAADKAAGTSTYATKLAALTAAIKTGDVIPDAATVELESARARNMLSSMGLTPEEVESALDTIEIAEPNTPQNAVSWAVSRLRHATSEASAKDAAVHLAKENSDYLRTPEERQARNFQTFCIMRNGVNGVYNPFLSMTSGNAPSGYGASGVWAAFEALFGGKNTLLTGEVEDLTEDMKRIAEEEKAKGEVPTTNTGANGPTNSAPKTERESDKLKPLDQEQQIHNLFAAARYNELFKQAPTDDNPFVQKNTNAEKSVRFSLRDEIEAGFGEQAFNHDLKAALTYRQFSDLENKILYEDLYNIQRRGPVSLPALLPVLQKYSAFRYAYSIFDMVVRRGWKVLNDYGSFGELLYGPQNPIQSGRTLYRDLDGAMSEAGDEYVSSNMLREYDKSAKRFNAEHPEGATAFVEAQTGLKVGPGGVLAKGQRDTVARAIAAFNSGMKGYVIGHQTGFGKGRINAALVAWALEHGMKVLVLTSKQNLVNVYARDLADVNSDTLRKAKITTLDHTIKSELVHKDMESDGAGGFREVEFKFPLYDVKAARLDTIADADVVITTYSQATLQDKQDLEDALQGVHGPKGERLSRIAETINFARNGNTLVIMDESHNMSGDATVANASTGRQENKLFRRVGEAIVESATHVAFSSATFSRRSGNLMFYLTAMPDIVKAIGGKRFIEWAEKTIGKQFLETIASRIVESGRYFALELKQGRNTDKYDLGTVYDNEADRTEAEAGIAAAAGLVEKSANGMASFHTDVNARLETMIRDEDNNAWQRGSYSRPLADLHVKVLDATSVQGRVIETFAWDGGKWRMVADAAIKELRAGRSPWIAFENTFEGYTDAEGKTAEEKFRTVALNIASKCVGFSWQPPQGGARLSFHFGDDTLNQDIPNAVQPLVDFVHDRGQQLADEITASFIGSNLPVSPLDAAKARITKTLGTAVWEISGRTHGLDLETMKVVKLGEKNKRKADAVIAFNQRSDGNVAVFFNQSGSEGVSAHLTRNTRNQHVRSMVFWQLPKDIVTYQQMRGRIDRRGMLRTLVDFATGAVSDAEPQFWFGTSPLMWDTLNGARMMRKLSKLAAGVRGDSSLDDDVEEEWESTENAKIVRDVASDYGTQLAAVGLFGVAGETASRILRFASRMTLENQKAFAAQLQWEIQSREEDSDELRLRASGSSTRTALPGGMSLLWTYLPDTGTIQEQVYDKKTGEPVPAGPYRMAVAKQVPSKKDLVAYLRERMVTHDENRNEYLDPDGDDYKTVKNMVDAIEAFPGEPAILVRPTRFGASQLLVGWSKQGIYWMHGDTNEVRLSTHRLSRMVDYYGFKPNAIMTRETAGALQMVDSAPATALDRDANLPEIAPGTLVTGKDTYEASGFLLAPDLERLSRMVATIAPYGTPEVYDKERPVSEIRMPGGGRWKAYLGDNANTTSGAVAIRRAPLDDVENVPLHLINTLDYTRAVVVVFPSLNPVNLKATTLTIWGTSNYSDDTLEYSLRSSMNWDARGRKSDLTKFSRAVIASLKKFLQANPTMTFQQVLMELYPFNAYAVLKYGKDQYGKDIDALPEESPKAAAENIPGSYGFPIGSTTFGKTIQTEMPYEPANMANYVELVAVGKPANRAYLNRKGFVPGSNNAAFHKPTPNANAGMFRAGMLAVERSAGDANTVRSVAVYPTGEKVTTPMTVDEIARYNDAVRLYGEHVEQTGSAPTADELATASLFSGRGTITPKPGEIYANVQFRLSAEEDAVLGDLRDQNARTGFFKRITVKRYGDTGNPLFAVLASRVMGGGNTQPAMLATGPTALDALRTARKLSTAAEPLAITLWKPVAPGTRFRMATETPEFKTWFAGSKVVDADGKPLVVYHGTPERSIDAYENLDWANATVEQYGKEDERSAISKIIASVKSRLPTFKADAVPQTVSGVKMLSEYVPYTTEEKALFDGIPSNMNPFDYLASVQGKLPAEVVERLNQRVWFEFGHRHKGKSTGATDTDAGFFFTDDESFATYFSAQREQDPFTGKITEKTGRSPSVMAVYLSILNPLDLRQISIEDANKLIAKGILPKGTTAKELRDSTRATGGSKDLQKYLSTKVEDLTSLGYDGIINYVSWAKQGRRTEYIAFSPTQIKSATANVGTFDATNPDIRFRLSDDTLALVDEKMKLVTPSVKLHAIIDQAGGIFPDKAMRAAMREALGIEVPLPPAASVSNETLHNWAIARDAANPGETDALVRRLIADRGSAKPSFGVTDREVALLGIRTGAAVHRLTNALDAVVANPGSQDAKDTYSVALGEVARLEDAAEVAGQRAGAALQSFQMGRRNTPAGELAYRLGKRMLDKNGIAPDEVAKIKAEVDALFAENAKLQAEIDTLRAATDKKAAEKDAAARAKADKFISARLAVMRAKVGAAPLDTSRVYFRLDDETKERLRGVWTRSTSGGVIETISEALTLFAGLAQQEGYAPGDIAEYMNGVAETVRRQELGRGDVPPEGHPDRELLPPAETTDTALTRAVRAAVLQAVRTLPGDATREDVVAKGIEILDDAGEFPGLTVETFQREWTGIGRKPEDNRDAAQKREWQLRQQARQVERIRDLARGVAPVKAAVRERMNLETRKLMALFRREYAEALRERRLPDAAIEEAIVSALGAVKNGLRNQIEVLEDALKTGEALPASQRTAEDDTETAELRDKIKELRAEYNELPDVVAKRNVEGLVRAKNAETKKQKTLDEQLRDLANGILPPVRGESDDALVPDTELVAMREETARLREVYKLELRNNPDLAERNVLASLDKLNAILSRIDTLVASGMTKDPRGNPRKTPDPRIKAVRDAIRAGNEQMKRNWQAANPIEVMNRKLVAKVTRLNRAINNLQAKIVAGEFSPAPRIPETTTPEILRLESRKTELRRRYDEGVEREAMRRRTLTIAGKDIPIGRVLTAQNIASDIVRMGMAAYDFSATFVQNAWLSTAFLRQVPDILYRSIHAATNHDRYLAYIENLRSKPSFNDFVAHGGGVSLGGEELTGGNTGADMAGRLAEKPNPLVSAFGKGLLFSSRSFAAYSGDMRLHAYEYVLSLYPDLSEGEKRAVANAVNIRGGYGNLKAQGDAASVLSKVLWSNRNFAAQWQNAMMGNGLMFNAGMKPAEYGPRRSWYEAAPGALRLTVRSIAGALALKLVIFGLQSMLNAADGDPEDDASTGAWDDEDTMLGKIAAWMFGPAALGNTSIDFNGRVWGVYRFIRRLAKAFKTSRPVYEIAGATGEMLSRRVNPLVAMELGAVTGKNTMGDPVGVGDFVPTPLSMGQLYEATADAFQTHGMWAMLAVPIVTGTTLTGAASSTYVAQYRNLRASHDARLTQYNRAVKAAKESGDTTEADKMETAHMAEFDIHSELNALEKAMKAAETVDDTQAQLRAAREWRNLYLAAREEDGRRTAR